jgi:hypothetical protein
MIMKKEKGEVSVGTKEIITPTLGELEVSVMPQGLIELSNDESDGLVTSITAICISDTKEYARLYISGLA